MDGGIVCFKGLFERFLPIAIEIAESFGHETVESRECTFLRTTFYNHVDEFHLYYYHSTGLGTYLLSFLEINFHEFVTTFFKVY